MRVRTPCRRGGREAGGKIIPSASAGLRDSLHPTPSRRQRGTGGLKPPPAGFVGWKSKPIAPRRRGKAPDQDAGTGEMVEQVDAIGALEQTEQIGAAKQFQAGAAEHAAQPPSICR